MIKNVAAVELLNDSISLTDPVLFAPSFSYIKGLSASNWVGNL